jgi:ABC-2 type transport system permease protein
MTAAAPASHGPLAKYLAIAAVALKQRLQERAILLSRALFYVIILFVFSRIWAKLGKDAAGYVWYLAVTEWVLLSQPRVYAEIERDVRSGEIAYQLTRPTHYLGTKLAEAAGETLIALFVLGGVGFVTAALMTSGLPEHPEGLAFALLLGVLASAVLVLASALIGLCAFFLQDVSPLYWVWQKCMFVLGGLFVPLALYPAWLSVLALWLPFSAVVAGPGSMVLEADPGLFALLALKLGACIVLALHALDFAFDRALGRLTVNGG